MLFVMPAKSMKMMWGMTCGKFVPGVTFILGNDLARGNVWEKSDGGVPPIVVPDVGKIDASPD